MEKDLKEVLKNLEVPVQLDKQTIDFLRARVATLSARVATLSAEKATLRTKEADLRAEKANLVKTKPAGAIMMVTSIIT